MNKSDTQKPLWGEAKTIRIIMIRNDFMAAGPTRLIKGKEYVLPLLIAGELLARGSAMLTYTFEVKDE